MAPRRPAPPPERMRADRDRPVKVLRPGTVAYRTAWDWQRELVARRQRSAGDDVLVLLQHPRVYTLGRRADRDHVLFDDAELNARGIELVDVDRGGDVTYHGPGQLVGYPILRLAGVHGVVDYVRALEEVLIRTLASFGIVAGRSAGFTGVWVGDEKVAAIGVRVSAGGVTSHGFALNVDSDLDDFAGIVPCGITDRGVCSMASLGVSTTVEEVATAAARAAGEVFAATLEPADVEDLGLVAPATGGGAQPAARPASP